MWGPVMMTREYDVMSFLNRKEGESEMSAFVRTGCRFKNDEE
jgi:hypothetical protein